MKIMILGATGYLGFNIVKRLLSESDISLTIAARDFEKLRSCKCQAKFYIVR